MKTVLNPLVAGTVCGLLLAAGIVGCGQKSEDEAAADAKKTTSSDQQSIAEEGLPTGEAPFAAELAQAGFDVAYFREFPAATAGRQGKMVLYNSASGGKDGGMIFVEERGPFFDLVWHWYFDDVKPASFSRGEFNQDGLWDIRVQTSKKGEQLELLQDETFTLRGGKRDDRIALNGTSSEPIPGNPLWHCFDGDATTAWRSRVDGGRKPFVEVASPLGLTDGILTIRAAQDGQPNACSIVADGKEVQEFQLAPTTEEQLVQLEPAVKTARRIRLSVESLHGGSGTAAIAELEIR